MRSLRSQMIALVLAVGVGVLSVLLIFGTLTVRNEYSQSILVNASTESPRAEAPQLVADIEDAYRRGGWEEVRSWVWNRPSERRENGEELAPPALAILTNELQVVAASDSGLVGKHGTRSRNGAIRLETSSGGSLSVVELLGGAPIRAGRDTVGTVLIIPRTVVQASPTASTLTNRFSAQILRRLWPAVLGILVLASVAAYLAVGRLLTPLNRLRESVHRIAAHDYGARVGDVGIRELSDVAQAFDALADSLAQSEQARARMIRDVAHELRTPLTNLRGQIEALQDGLRTADTEALASLHEEAMLLQRLVADLDDLARADTSQLDFHVESLDLRTEFLRVAESFVRSARVTPEQIRVDCPATVTVRADRARLAQMLRNLIQNAIQSRTNPPVEITVRGFMTDSHVVVEVLDNGPGIPAEHLPRIFDRLYRPDPSRSRGTGGSGLGLSIVKAIVEAHGGSASIQSSVGQGTSVRLEFVRS